MSGNNARESKQAKWKTIRDSIAHDGADTTLGVTDRKWADVPTHEGSLSTIKIRKAPLYFNEWIFRFRGTANVTNIVWKLWGYREGDDAEYIANGTAVIGTQTATMTNDGTATLYMDTIVISAQRWLKTFATTDASGNNEMAKLHGDAMGLFLPYMEITTINGTGSVSVDFVGV